MTPQATDNVDDQKDLKNYKTNLEIAANRNVFGLNEKIKNKIVDLPPLPLEDDHEGDNCLSTLTDDFEGADIGQRDDFENTLKDKKILRDRCFYAKPRTIIFKNFSPGTSYTQKVAIYNKFSKWSYIRYDSINLSISDNNVLTVEHIDAAKIRPGLFIVVTVNFLPNTETEITGALIFLTLNSENTKDFHEFKIRIHCVPAQADPLVDLTKLCFPTFPIWKDIEPGSIHKRLTISNFGLKTCNLLFTPKSNTRDSFNWDFEENEYPSKKFTPTIHADEENSITDYETYEVELRAKSCIKIRVTFFPKYVGLHHDVLEILFKVEEQIIKTQTIPIWAEVTGSEIHLNPKFVDLGIIIMGTEIYQANFTISNTGRSSADISMLIPKYLCTEIQIYPKTISLQTDTSWTFTVRLTPSENILQKAKTYYDKTCNTLNIPIKINVNYPNEKGPTLTLKILATPTSSTLVIEPDFVVLGMVNTQESVLSRISITNPSLVIQDFGFLNIPPTMTIQPNYGFGRILPGETLPLHLIYSAWLTDIPGNEAEASGLASDRRFEIRVATVNELVGKRNHVVSTKVPTNRLLNLPPKEQWRPTGSDYNKQSDQSRMPRRRFSSISQTVRSKIPFKDLIGDLADDDNSSSNLADSDVASDSFGPLDDDVRELKNITEIFAFIVDPLCQLSEQIIEFPATPCDSYSLTSVNLMGFNSASYPHCTCGFIEDQIKEFEAWYEFKCSSPRVRMSPRYGHLKNGETIKITLMHKPKMSHKVTANVLESMEIKDKTLPGEMTLLENFEAYIHHEWATCALNIKMKDGDRRDETLLIKLTCPVVKPDIIILNPTRIIEFGMVVIGSKSRNILEIKNISTRSVKIKFSLLNPFGPFFMPPGKILEPGSILSIPITYRPKVKKDNPLLSFQDIEFFEIRAASTKTIWRMSLSGRGVIPSWNILPEMRVARLEAKIGKPDEIKLTIENTSEATLVFVLEIIELLEGSIPVQLNKNKVLKENKKKKISMFLEEEEELAIFDKNMKPLDNKQYFTFVNFDNDLRLPVEAMKKKDFVLRFQVPSTRISFTGKRSKKNKERIGVATPGVVKKGRLDAMDVYYVARLKLLLEDVQPIQDIVLIATAKT
ncbi:cilia- and flagella-associated protein 74 [Cephus cinctus]|uniref:Cilia- and flagella-associated protein 74 n=1 Tax=Cephus cinctus TaxID=211228 RepID=A0AAJ7RI59_CEPCN|nr:cilia- and flagella-associated protein 74 [Cephus cinctus]